MRKIRIFLIFFKIKQKKEDFIIFLLEYSQGRLYLIQFFQDEKGLQKFYAAGIIQEYAFHFGSMLQSFISIEDFDVLTCNIK